MSFPTLLPPYNLALNTKGMSYIKTEFMRRILDDEGQRLLRNQGKAIRKELNFHTHRLIQDRKAEVSVTGPSQVTLKLTHPIYERFLDIRKNTKSKGSNRKSSKGYRIHNRFMFGHYLSIANRMTVDFTDEVAEQIKHDFEKGGRRG